MFVAVSLALVALLTTSWPAYADWGRSGDTVPAWQVIDNDVLIWGTDVLIDGTINGDALAVGSTVTVNGSVSGSLVSLGRTVTVNGEVRGSVYTLARTLKLGSAAKVMHSAHFAGLLLDSQPGSWIGRDLVAASLRGRISSEIRGTLNAVILLLTFNGRIGDGLYAPGASTQIPGQAELGPVLSSVGLAGAKVLGLAAPALSTLQQDKATAVAVGSVGGVPTC